MSSATRVQLGWEAPEEVWDKFTTEVEREWGAESPYAGIQIEESWREFKASEECDRLEAVVDRLVEASPLSRDSDEKEKLTRSPASETTQVWVRVNEDVKTEMSTYADECGVPYHVVLRGVLNWYVDGGRTQRVVEKLEAIVDEVESAFDVVAEEETVTKTERVTSKIASKLGDVFRADDLADAINEETSGTEYYHETYAPRVIDKKGVERLERDDRPDTFLPPEKYKSRQAAEIIEELGGDTVEDTAPTFDKKDYASAAWRAGVDDREEANEYLDRVLERLSFVWNPRSEQFEPGDDDASERRPDADVTSYTAGSAPGQSFEDLDAGHPEQGGVADD